MTPFCDPFRAQKQYFATNVTRPYAWRLDQLERMERLVRENENQLQEAMAKDFKTAPQEKVFETAAQLAVIQSTRSELKGWMEPIEAPLPRFLATTGHKGMVYRDPYGVTLIIGPFNGPLTLLIHPAVTALAAGNTCILKLSEALIATSALLLDLFPKYFDPCALVAFAGGREDVTQLLKLPFDFIFFTGSTKVGKVVMKAAAEHLTPVLLELGGQNPAIVDETANIKDAAQKLVWGATAWGGQWCTSTGYACVHESIAEAFVVEAKKALLKLYGEDPKANPDYSRIISTQAASRLAGLIDPGKIVAGGQSDPDARYVAPTLLFPVSWDDPIMEEEIFGPILPILTYKSLEQLLARIKTLPLPLSAFIFSRDQKTIDRFVGGLSFGGGAVNQTNIHLFIDSMPFGGVGPSGIGHYYGKYGFDSLTHAKSILISPPDVAIDHLFPPFTPKKIEDLNQWFAY